MPKTPTQLLLSVPPAVTPVFHQLVDLPEALALHDPPGANLGSGGGTAHLLQAGWKASGDAEFDPWCASGKRILLHAGGQSRRLPAYGPTGKALMPIPVFRWSTGQRLDQTLLDLQRPLLEDLVERAPASMTTLVASGDVLVWNDGHLPEIPDVDVLCVGLWSTPEIASNHGVFFTPRSRPDQFDTMLQKPPVSEIQERSSHSLFLLDVGIWIFSNRAVDVLMRKCGWVPSKGFPEGTPGTYDLYTAFGEALGRNPAHPDPEISSLTTAILPLQDGEFYHFGTSSDMIRSTLALQNRVTDPRRIRSPLIKPHPAIFVQEAYTPCPMTSENQNVWIENSLLGPKWTLHENHVITGIPENDWEIDLPKGTCLDVVPLQEDCCAVRIYGFSDAFRGPLDAPETLWMGQPVQEWFQQRGLPLPQGEDLQFAPIFPVCKRAELDEAWIQWLISGEASKVMSDRWNACGKVSASDLLSRGQLADLFEEKRKRLGTASLPALARHAHRSVFYQVDLHHLSQVYAAYPELEFPSEPDAGSQLFSHMHDCMFRAEVSRHRNTDNEQKAHEAFDALRNAILSPYLHHTPLPRNTALSDQVIWARSPVRLDLAGGWTDTPPGCFLHGGSVVNLAVELNGQPPIQVFARVGKEHRITLRSIDLGITQHIETYEELASFNQLGSGFSIPKAALALAGFHPDYQAAPQMSLASQLEAFGGGIELSLLCAVPKGSGLGTSSILAATVLGALSELCGLGWDILEIGNRTLALEQMLTSGGGWQDQYGGITRGLKLLRTTPGLDQTPEIRWLPDHVVTDPALKENMLLYYTGITRVAKDILGEIVRGMFLNRKDIVQTLSRLSLHAEALYETLQQGHFSELGPMIAHTWQLNQMLDPGTNPPEVEGLLKGIEQELLGAKLLGAGGGGYLLIIARDTKAAASIREKLETYPPNSRARFVDFDVSTSGLQITRS